MPMFFKKSLIVSISSILMLFPRLQLNSCGPFLYDEEFRVWLFQPNLVNNEALIPFTYSTNLYFHPASKDENLEEYFDTSYIKINIAEWQAELPSAKTTDTYKLLYDTDPADYLRQVKGDSLRENSFYQALKGKHELLAYFNFAKECENQFGYKGSSEEKWSWKKDSLAIRQLATKAESLTKSTKSPFIRLRSAYQLVKAHEYLKDTEGVRKSYDTYIKDSKSKSWILGSAMFYYAKAQPTIALRNMWAANCFDQTIDKKLQSLKLVSNDDKQSLPIAWNKHQQAVFNMMHALRSPGRTLESMEKIYAAEPSQSELPMLVEREINKLEDWLYSYKMTGNDTEIGRTQRYPKKKNENGEMITNDPLYESSEKYAEIQKINWESDRQYLNQVASFVDKIVAENKVKDRDFMLLSAAHLAFLQQNFSKVQQYLALLKTRNNVKPNISVQAELTQVLCDLYEKSQITETTEQNIAQFESALQKAKSDITDFETFREQVYIFIGEKFIEQGKIAKGCLLTMASERFTNYVGYAHENGYHRLYAFAKPVDFDEAIRIISAPKTSFERMLANEKRPYSLTNDGYYDEKKGVWVEYKTTREWDINKIKDYKVTYYIRNDEIDSALLVSKTIPNSFWQSEPYHSMLNCNPFYIDIAHPHARTFADSTRYNKTSFLEKVTKLRKIATKNPSVEAHDFYLLGNAYYNMTWYGNFWLMSDIYWGSGGEHSNYFKNNTTFINNYLGLEKAQKQYELCLQNTKDEKLAALCHFMIGYCVKTRTEYQFYQHYNRWDDASPKPPVVANPATAVFTKRFPKRLSNYENSDYWCTNYLNLATLYSDAK